MSTENSNSSGAFTLIPLRQWIEGVGWQHLPVRSRTDFEHELLRKTTVAYGVAELCRRARSLCGADFPSSSPACEHSRWSIHNFAVRSSTGETSTWKNIKGVDRLSPRLPMNIVEPSFLCNDAEQEDQMGRYLEVHFPTLPEDTEGAAAAVSQSEEDDRCHALGVILYELFSQLPPGSPGGSSSGSRQPARKKTRLLGSTVIDAGKKNTSPSHVGFETSVSSARIEGAMGDVSFPQVLMREEGNAKKHTFSQKIRYVPLSELGFPSSISLLVQNLLDCGVDNRPDDAYDSLDAVSKDLHLLLLDPIRFMFDCEITPDNGRVQLSFREHTLYGRENEVAMITDAFCRVSTGKCEAFFIGGFSGSGKSRLVNSLTARIDIAEGYVITHKFDAMSKERCLLEVVAVINDLCLLIREKRTQQDLRTLAKNITEAFGTDFSMLAQLLPNIYVLSPSRTVATEGGSGIRLNLQSVCFIVQRFMRVVSSKAHPVMLFLDDLQWCDSSALTLIEDILCDSIGSTCFFFVGSYRSNEVEKDHDLFHLIDSLSSHGIPMTRLSLEGLTPKDLKQMVSDALGIFPRISEPLSDMVFQKTKGNPFSVRQFFACLVDRGLLEYNICHRRWMWDEECISFMDITCNVLCLLSSKMSTLSENAQLALKVASCFGIKIKEAIVNNLLLNSEYSGMLDGMEHIVKEGFMIKVGEVGSSEFKFSHDKIREAAYSLIPKSEKKKYHHSLGMVLYSTTKGSNINGILFSITDQINYIDSSEVPHKLKLDFAKLNEMSGKKAMDLSDYVTARSYLNTTLALLPAGHWEHHYDLSLRSHFLLAKSAYSSGISELSFNILQIILHHARCLHDKLEAYNLVAQILYDRGELQGAYTTSNEVLSKLGESIPDELGTEETKEITESTSHMVRGLSEDSLLKMKEMKEMSKEQFILKFYLKMAIVAFHANAAMLPFINCRVIQLSITHGICKESLLGLVQHAALSCLHNTMDGIQEACRIGKLAMNMLGRFDSATEIIPQICHIYYGIVAIYSEPVQSIVDSLRSGFESGIASGDTSNGLINAFVHLSKCLIAGTNLTSLLKRTNYYVEVTKTHDNNMARKSFLLFRDTILILMGKECSNCPEELDNHQGAAYHKAVRAFWIGHHERSHHFTERIIHGIIPGYSNHRIQVIHYYGLNPFKVARRSSGFKTKDIPRKALKTLKAAAGYSEWNFRNKVHLLEAQIFSSDKRNEKAKVSYAAAILSAQCSGFVHEQGLACELAGFHYKKMGDHRSACGLFNQAKQCYEKWGSQMKVDSITRQLNNIQICSVHKNWRS